LKTYADSSFLVSLYLWDAHSDIANARMKQIAQPFPLTPLHRHELRNAIRLAVKRREIDNAQRRDMFRTIDRDLHGSGPHLDNFETADTRVLLAGIGFSVEPGVYLPGRFGVRSEINVFLGETGPEVTPGQPQRDLQLV